VPGSFTFEGVKLLKVAFAAGVAVTLPFSGDGNTINGCYSSGGALKVKMNRSGKVAGSSP
jgi:hypothetical protein